MSFLATLFSQSRFERKSRATSLRRNVMSHVREIVSSSALRSRRRGARATGCSLALAANEKLEPRLAFDAVAFEGVDTVTIVVSEGDPLFITEQSTVPTSIRYSTQGNFAGDINNQGTIFSSDRFGTLRVTEGRTAVEDVVLADQYPSQDAQFVSIFKPAHAPHEGTNPYDTISRIGIETRGVVSIKQSDGSVSEWTFTNWNRQTGNNERYDNNAIRFTSGLNYGGVEPLSQGSLVTAEAQSARPDQNYPVSIRAVDISAYQRGFQVQWRHPLAVNSEPRLNLQQ